MRPLLGTYGDGLDVGMQSAASDGMVRVLVGNAVIGDVFSVSSYDGAGVESAHSNEVPLLVPAILETPTAAPRVATPTQTATRTATPVVTTTARPTMTVLPTVTALPTITPRPTATPQPSVTPQPSTTPQGSATPLPSVTTRPTTTSLPTTTPVRTATAVATRTALPQTTTPTARPVDPTPSAPPLTPAATATPAPTDTPSASTGVIADLSAIGTLMARVTAPTGGGNHDLEVIRDGDRPPPGNTQSSRQYDTYDGANSASEDWIGYAFATPQRFRSVIFQEGRHFWDGGWFETLGAQVRRNGVWSDVDGLTVTPPYPGVNALSYETFALTFTPTVGDAIRIDGRPGGSAAFISVGELRVMGDNSTVVPSGSFTDVTTRGAIIARTTAPTGGGNHNIEIIRDGDLPPVGNAQSARQYDTFDGANVASEDWIGYAFDTPQHFCRVLFQEGRQFWDGGWFETLTVQVRQDGAWIDVTDLSSAPVYAGANGTTYERFMLTFAPTSGDAIRLYGRPGGSADFISVGELRVYTDEPASPTGVVAPVADAAADAATPTAAATGGAAPPAPIDAATAGDTGDKTSGGTAGGGGVPAAPSAGPAAGAARCGDGRRDDGEQCDGTDDAQCAGRCRSDCTCGAVVELPLVGWWEDGDATAVMLQDAVTGEPVLAVTAAMPLPTDGGGDAAAVGGATFGASENLALALPQLAVTARARAAFDVEVEVRAGDGSVRTLAYRTAGRAPDQDAPRFSADGTEATFDVGAAMAGGEVGTTYRDLARDLNAAFGLSFASVAQVRVRGTLELFRVALASDRARDEDTPARLVLPLDGWDRRGNGGVLENAYDPDLPGLTVQVDPSDKPVSVIQLAYPPAEAPKTMPFGTLVLAIRDAAPFAVEVKGLTTAGDTVDLTYSLGAIESVLRLRRADQPLVTTPRAGGPYADVRLDLAADTAALNDGQVLAGIRSVQLRGAFIAGDIQLRDPIEISATP